MTEGKSLDDLDLLPSAAGQFPVVAKWMDGYRVLGHAPDAETAALQGEAEMIDFDRCELHLFCGPIACHQFWALEGRVQW